MVYRNSIKIFHASTRRMFINHTHYYTVKCQWQFNANVVSKDAGIPDVILCWQQVSLYRQMVLTENRHGDPHDAVCSTWSQGLFTLVIYYAIAIAITIRFKNGLYTHFWIAIPIQPIEKNRNHNRFYNRNRVKKCWCAWTPRFYPNLRQLLPLRYRMGCVCVVYCSRQESTSKSNCECNSSRNRKILTNRIRTKRTYVLQFF